VNASRNLRIWPLDSLTAADHRRSHARAVAAYSPGALTRAMDLCECPQRLQPALDRALGGALFAVNDRVAADAVQRFGTPCVTLEGRRHSPGVLEGGWQGDGATHGLAPLMLRCAEAAAHARGAAAALAAAAAAAARCEAALQAATAAEEAQARGAEALRELRRAAESAREALAAQEGTVEQMRALLRSDGAAPDAGLPGRNEAARRDWEVRFGGRGVGAKGRGSRVGRHRGWRMGVAAGR